MINNNQFKFNYDNTNNQEIYKQNFIINDLPKVPPEPVIKKEEPIMEKIPKKIKIYDLIVIGAGWSGLLASKYAKQNGLNVLVLEARETIGGVWKYSEDPNITTTIKNAHTTSSKTFTEFSDFPMPKDYPSFPSHKEVYSYLVKYANHFKLAPHIIFNTKISKAEKIIQNNINVWKVEDDKGNFFVSKFLTVSTGAHTNPNIPRKFGKSTLDEFSGEVIHSINYKKLTPKFWNKRVLIIGGGETASDIANEVSLYAKKLYWSIFNGQWFIPKLNTNTPKGKEIAEPADHYTSALNMWVHPVGKKGGVYLFEDFVEFFWGKCGHGIKEWVSDAPYQRQFLNKSSEVLNKVAYGRITPKRKIEKIFGKKIWFDDGTFENFDIIILCTGYKINFPFLPNRYQQSNIRKNYKLIFHPHDPSLSFVGFARPVIGSIPALSEVQSIYLAKIYSGKLKLPSKGEMIKVIKRDKQWWENYFKNTSQRLGGLVNIYIYSEDLMKKCNMYPNYKKLFFKSPRKWWRAITTPYNNSRYLLNDEKYHPQIFDNFKQYKPHAFHLRFWFVHLMYFVFMAMRPFYLFFRQRFSNKKTNSIIELDENDKEDQKRKVKNLTLLIVALILIIFVIIVPEWRTIAIENIKKLLGPTEVLQDKRFLTFIVLIILYLLYI